MSGETSMKEKGFIQLNSNDSLDRSPRKSETMYQKQDTIGLIDHEIQEEDLLSSEEETLVLKKPLMRQ